MRRRKLRSRRKTVCIVDESSSRDALAGLWSLRIYHELQGYKNILGYPSMPALDITLINLLELSVEDGNNIDRVELVQRFEEKLDEYEERSPAVEGVLNQNLESLADLVGLSDVDKSLLAFTIIVQSHSGLAEASETQGELTADKLNRVLSIILNIDLADISKALSKNGVLARTGLLAVDRTDSIELKRKLDLPENFVDTMFESHSNVLSLLSQYFTQAPKAKLKSSSFDYLNDQYCILNSIIKSSREMSLKGINILLYGPPGTGKTELAYLLGQESGSRCFEISHVEDDDNPGFKNDRLRFFQLSQHALAKQKDALLIFDEIEDVFNDIVSPIFGRIRSNNPRKAWTNRLLEANTVPSIWISNEIDQIDPAYLRRFSFALKMDIPPCHVRERILGNYLKPVGIDKGLIKRIASDSRISPAMAANASRIVSAIANNTNLDDGKVLENILNNSLCSMGHHAPLKNEQQNSLSYRVEALNPDYDLTAIMNGLEQCPQLRICLYGPPGTGKTAFGQHIAKSLEKPLLVKRASDILDPYVGMAEKNIASMFNEANRDSAVLMLDEADSFLRDRRGAKQSWEVSQVNELLTQMETYDGLFICSTNLVDDLDEASIRRFDYKIKLDYLKPDQAWILFCQAIKDSGSSLPRGRSPWKLKVGLLSNLTPGDFALVMRQNRLSNKALSAEGLYEALERESVFKRGASQHTGIGFTASI